MLKWDGIPKTKVFNRKVYKLRQLMHGDIRTAKNLARVRRNEGYAVRVVDVSSAFGKVGYVLYERKC